MMTETISSGESSQENTMIEGQVEYVKRFITIVEKVVKEFEDQMSEGAWLYFDNFFDSYLDVLDKAVRKRMFVGKKEKVTGEYSR